ncbi:MAG: hypothetical protein KDD63_06215, partial [Bacteroidetes bacterium]|nr:hypothetical protein [Bacteroidota bacterium]
VVKSSPDTPVEDLQTAFSILKLRFNQLLDQLDIFADAFTQRSEHEIGLWLAGLDELARDALTLQSELYKVPPLICYLDRGHGAAIRRTRARLPGGTSNPVAVIRVPRERLVGSGIAASLVHEVGHQGAGMLNLIQTMRTSLRAYGFDKRRPWKLFDRWLSEIISDCWGVATLGISATTGLMGVVSLPGYFVFHINPEDPHPFPWIRVMISAQVGKILYPSPQWDKLMDLWLELYPMDNIQPDKREMIDELIRELPAFAHFLVNHRSSEMNGMSFQTLFPIRERQPEKLRILYQKWKRNRKLSFRAQPSLAFAVLGQARADGKLSPETENAWLSRLLRWWAVRRTMI